MSWSLTFYNCTACGYLGTFNFRDAGCPQCGVAASSVAPVKQIVMREYDTPDGYGSKVLLNIDNAPHVEEGE